MARSFGVLQLFLWTFASALSLIVAFQALEALRPGTTRDLVSLGAVEGLVYGLVCFFVWQRYASSTKVVEFLGIRKTHGALLGVGLLLGVTLQAPADTLQYLVELLGGAPTEAEVASRALLMRAESEAQASMMMVSTGVLVPFVEELLFRGAFFGALKARLSALAAGAFTGVAFVISHPDIRIWLPLVLVAVVLSLLRVVSGSMLPGFLLHLAFNAVTLALIVLKLVPVDQRLALPWQLSVAGWLASGALVYGALKLAGSDEALQARSEDDAR